LYLTITVDLVASLIKKRKSSNASDEIIHKKNIKIILLNVFGDHDNSINKIINDFTK